MRTSILFSTILFGILLLPASTHAAQAVTTRIEAVTVYTDGATVTRSARVSLSAGETQLQFSGLSSQMSRDRVQVELTGDGVNLGQVKFNDVQQRDAFDAEVRKLQSEIEAVEERIRSLQDSTATAQLKLKFLDGIAQGYAKESWFEGARGNADISSWRSALDVLDEGSAGARAAIRGNAASIRAAQQDLSKLQRELQQLQGRRRVSSEMLVTVASTSARTATIRLHYFQANAAWSPTYVANLDSNSRNLNLKQKAKVKQWTDEDWPNVALTLSTSEPSGELEAPEMFSEFLDLRDPRTAMRKQTMNMSPATLADSAAIEEAVVTAGMHSPETDIDNFSVSYRVPGRVAVPNDRDDEQAFDLADMNFDVDLRTRIVPSESSEAFLVAQFTYDEALPLYANDMMVYVDKVFVGQTWLPTALPSDEITLPVGQDRRVEFTVRDQGGKKGESGFIGRRNTELSAHLFEITNRRDHPTMVEVFDRYPTAVNDEIEVSVPREATPPSEKDFEDKPGVVVWRKSLQGGETWSISHQYEVSYPSGKSLVSNRR